MKALASSLGAWRSIERQEGTKAAHKLTFSLAVVGAIGQPHGLVLTSADDDPGLRASDYDAVFVSVQDARNMVDTAVYFERWGLPMRRAERRPGFPLVWAGGQGLRNPCPYSPIADLIVIGDAEGPLPVLLDLWERHGNSSGFLAAASTVPGVYVPAHHSRGEVVIEQAVASDISVSLRHALRVGADGSRRVEIARGCRSKCAFCTLGWRTPYRENGASDVLAALDGGPRLIHLQAGDAESHSEIDTLRSAIDAQGYVDRSWTGRLDAIDSERATPSTKRYAFGVEGVSHRLRRAVGKARLTDDYLVGATLAHLASSGAGPGRAAWHLIAGLPTQRIDEAHMLLRVLALIDAGWRGPPKNIELHWQPLQPQPGTPMQWCAAGGGARRLVSVFRALERQRWVRVRNVAGRTDEMALLCTILARADERGADLLAAMRGGRVTPAQAEAMTGSPASTLDPDAPLPWDFVVATYQRDVLRKAHDVMMRRLSA